MSTRADTQDELFSAALVSVVKRHPDWEMDELTAHLIDTGFPEPYVSLHLQAIYAAMTRMKES